MRGANRARSGWDHRSVGFDVPSRSVHHTEFLAGLHEGHLFRDIACIYDPISYIRSAGITTHQKRIERRCFRMDERAVVHRYKASRLSLAVGLLIMLGFFQYDVLWNRIIRWDYLIIITAMFVVKVAARIYYHKTN